MVQSTPPRVYERRNYTAYANEKEMKLSSFIYEKYYAQYPEINGKEFLEELKSTHGIAMTEAEIMRGLSKLCNYSYFSEGVVLGSSTRLLFMGKIAYSRLECSAETQGEAISGLTYSFSLPRLKDDFPQFDWDDFPNALKQLEVSVGGFYYDAFGACIVRREKEVERR
jgi:hypothetical protein